MLFIDQDDDFKNVYYGIVCMFCYFCLVHEILLVLYVELIIQLIIMGLVLLLRKSTLEVPWPVSLHKPYHRYI
jgi:hypothetical protein